ncbi:MAG: lipopolysaccharide biosynthesis protein [Pseudomonadota bacterium]
MDGASAIPPHSPLRRAAQSAARNLGWLLASRGVLAVLSLIYLGIVTRTLGVEGFGRFALITTAAQALTLAVGFQTWQIVVQYGVRHLANGDEAALRRLLRLCGLLDVCSAVAGAVLGAWILLSWGEQFGIRPGLQRDTMIFLIVQLVTIRSMPLGILRLRDRFSLAAAADTVTPVMRLIGAVFVALVVPTVKGFLYAWMVAELATAIAYWIVVARTEPLAAIWRARASRAVLRDENPGIVRFALSTNANATLNLSGKQLPLLLVGATIGTFAAGSFRLAAQLSQALAKLAQLLTRAAFPEIVRTIHDASARVVTQLLGRMFLLSSAGALVILALIALLGQPLLILVGGREYAGAYTALLWLASAGCLDLATVGFEPVLMALHRSATALAIRIVAVAVMIGAALALMPAHGATGAAMAVFAGALVTAVLVSAATFAVARPARQQ